VAVGLVVIIAAVLGLLLIGGIVAAVVAVSRDRD
jgi:hypothetical protein